MSAVASSAYCEEIETLVYGRLDGRDRGWRVELLVEQLTSKLEQQFLLCSCCSGLMRDACLLEKEGKQELRCYVCIPEGVAWQPLEMNRAAINEKLIRCPLRERGCGWTDSVSRGIQHLGECGFLPVLCPLGCVESGGERSGELARVERRRVAEHEREFCPQRELSCEFCGREVRACEMNPHLGECLEFPVDCPNGCEAAGGTDTGQGKRGDVPLHLAECPLQTVRCPYWDYGCGEEMERRQIDSHEREYMHTHFKLAMQGMERILLESNELRGSHENIKSLEKSNSEKDLEIISVKKEIKELKQNQIEFKDKINILEKQNTELKATITTLVSVIGESILVSGRLAWSNSGVREKIKTNTVSLSDPFYVGLYKCQCSVEWDFNSSGKVGCFIHVMKGEFDDKQNWPFVYRYKIVLLNQNRNKEDYIWCYEITKNDLQKLPECFQKPTEVRNRSFGARSFISSAEILSKRYCKEDYISLSITVEQMPIL